MAANTDRAIDLPLAVRILTGKHLAHLEPSWSRLIVG
jgi:hypothetical protein